LRPSRPKLSETAKSVESLDARLRGIVGRIISAAVTGKIDVRGGVRKALTVFPRIVLAAEIVDRLHNDPNFHRVKFQKVLYLREHHLGMDLEGYYWRQAAGPLDNRMLYSLESQMQRQKWFATQKVGQGIRYVPMKNAGGHRKYFDDYWAEYREGLDSLLELMRPLNTEQSEIVATLFAAWNDLIIAGLPFTDEDILHEVRGNWHESKELFDEDRLRRALKWMRDQGFIPRGLGKPTRK
jgi:type I restriction enzyme, S subunit